MPIVRVDFSQASKGGISVPDGTHTCEVVQVVEAESARSKSPQLQVTLVVADGPAKGGQITDFIPLADGAMWRRANFFKACGFNEDGEADVNTDEITRLSPEGEEINEEGILITVSKTSKMEQFEGKDRRRVNLQYAKLDDGSTPEAAEEEPAQTSAAKPSISRRPVVAKKSGPARRAVKM